MPERDQKDVRAWVQARVSEAGSVDGARPDSFTCKAWRELCRHYDVAANPRKIGTLEEALRAVADLAKP